MSENVLERRSRDVVVATTHDTASPDLAPSPSFYKVTELVLKRFTRYKTGVHFDQYADRIGQRGRIILNVAVNGNAA